ncbi:unnamed protein product [Orchesella dallaii]|uniref:TIR domain-containing protein n=1 Tax=Orchesella dallaii TaxID=48710 RepID=A0ABP1QNY3_9HEXA
MDYQRQHYTVFIVFLLFISSVDSYRADLTPSPSAMAASTRALLSSSKPSLSLPPIIQQQQHGCVWSTVKINNNNNMRNGSTSSSSGYPPFLQRTLNANSYSLDCHLRTLSTDFWGNYTFNRDQLESTSRLVVKCNDKLLFESFLNPNQSFFRLRNLGDVSIHSCKIRKMPSRIWSSLGLLKKLTISSFNGEWSSSVGMEVEHGAFEGLSNLEKLDLSFNNIYLFPDPNIFCPLRNLIQLNLSRNHLSEVEEFGSSTNSAPFRSVYSGEESGGSGNSPCVLKIQNVDLSFNTLRQLNNNAFAKLKNLAELRLHNNLIVELADNVFSDLPLRTLDISSNRLVALPPTIFKNLPLRELYLQNNSISALSPQLFSGLDRLVVLKLSFNQLSHIASSIFNDLVKVESLHLDNNRIESINPNSFQSMTKLQNLDLSSNQIKFVDSRLFSSLNLLRQLYLDHNKISQMDVDSLQYCTRLEDVGLADNLLTEVPVALRAGLKHLVTLDIGENKISNLTNESFLGMTQLYGLRLVDNKLLEIPKGLCDPMNRLRVLNVAQNHISKISPGAFSSCPDLRALRLDANLLQELPPTLAPQLPSLLWLNVSENRLQFADYRRLPTTLEWFDVSHNELVSLGGLVNEGGNDTIPLSLRVVDASYNKLNFLDYTTTIPPTLETLRLNHNELSKVAPDTFIRSSRLRRVELMGNKLENLPLSALRFPPVQNAKPLPEFFLSKNPFLCNCEMEWLTRINEIAVLRQYPKIADFDTISCRPTFAKKEVIPVLEASSKDFLCKYNYHCPAWCACCNFDFCDCASSCPNNCTCYHDNARFSQNIVTCSNSGHTAIPTRLPMDATEIFLDGNVIPVLKSHTFIGKTNLKSLYLNNSKIETIANKSFNGLKALEILHMEDNYLRELQGFEFANLDALRELYLQDNKISYINENTFNNLKFLQVLRLDGNLLVDFAVWTLSENRYLNSVMLSKNPFSCACDYLIPFGGWAKKTSIVVDWSLVTCQPVQQAVVGSNSTQFYGDDDTPSQVINVISMCDHNTELNFDDNVPHIMDSEILLNHISAEKVASDNNNNNNINSNNPTHHQNNFPSINNDISTAEGEEAVVDQESGDEWGWTIFSIILIMIVIIMLIIVFLVFRKDHSNPILPRWLSTVSSPLFHFCCGGSGAGAHGKSGSAGGFGGVDDGDKLFDAYFLYSRKDEDLLLQKIAPELESPSSAYSAGVIPPPPPHGLNYRLCLHYRDLCLSADNPLNTEMVLSACDASKRIVILFSRSFLQEMSHPSFRVAIQTAITRNQNKLLFILLPPFTEQNVVTIYPELKSGHFSTMNQITSLEWSDSSFWSKLKLILPTPTLLTSSSSPSGLNSTSTISSSNSSAIFNMAHHHHHHNLINYNNAMSLHDYAYNTINSQSQQYHRNILPFQHPSVPKHHIALAWQHQQQQLQQNQNFYNNSQHSQIIPIPGYPGHHQQAGLQPAVVVPNFNESFRRHLQIQQSQNKTMTMSPTNSNQHQHHHHNPHHQHQISNCSSSTSNNNPSIQSYQPLDSNYSSSNELLEHVYSTLDSPPMNKEGSCLSDQHQQNENSSAPPQLNRLNNNNVSNNPAGNSSNSNNSGLQCSNNASNSNSTPDNSASATGNNNNGNGGTMYFV